MSQVRYVSNTDINRVKWDTCIKAAINSRIYAMSWYLDIVSDQWDAVIYGDYQMVFPVVYKQKYFIKKLYYPLFCQQLGFFTNENHLFDDRLIISEIINCIKSKFFFGMQFSITSEFSENIVNIYKWNYNVDKRINVELSLNKSYNFLSKSYSVNLKRKLKKQLSHNLSIADNLDVPFFVAEFRKYVGPLTGLKNRDYSIMTKLINAILKHGFGQLLSVYNNDGIIISTAFIVSFQSREILLFNYSHPEFKKYDGMTFLIDWYIKKNASFNKIMDFEGSNLDGIRRFYLSFGGLEIYYYLFTRSLFNRNFIF